jgi:acyl-CoA synthetase (NDP forming)
VLLIDGTQAQIREVHPADRAAVRRLHAEMSPESLYLRFFSLSQGIGVEVADHIYRPPGSGHAAVGAWVAGELVGVASYEVVGDDELAEVGLVVADRMHGRGVGTLLLEHLASLARTRGSPPHHPRRERPASSCSPAGSASRSFGNPRKFARTARRVGRRIPLLTVISGRSEAGLRAAASHTAAAATPDITREALFRQAGIVAVHGLGELVDAAAMLACQPAPEGPHVAIVSNAGGAGVLAAAACADAGLVIAGLSAMTRDELGNLLPSGAACANPVDTSAAIAPDQFRRCVDLVAADDGIDAVIVIVAPTAASDLVPAVTTGNARKPTAAVVLGQPDAVDVRQDEDGRRIPSYASPENAARALVSAWSYGRWRARPPGRRPDLPGLRTGEASDIVAVYLDQCPEGGWLSPAESMRLLECYGLPLAGWCMVRSEDDAVRAATGLGGRVALKADVPGVVHKSDAGAVALELADDDQVRRAYRVLAERFTGRLEGVLVQRMAPEGIEVLCGITQEPVFGPLIVFGLGGVATDVFGDTGARLTPLTDLDAAELIRSVHSAPLLLGHRGRPTDVAGLRDTLLRLSNLAEDHPNVAELDLNPIIARPDGVVAIDARVASSPNAIGTPICADCADTEETKGQPRSSSAPTASPWPTAPLGGPPPKRHDAGCTLCMPYGPAIASTSRSDGRLRPVPGRLGIALQVQLLAELFDEFEGPAPAIESECQGPGRW